VDSDAANFWVITTGGDVVPGRTFIEADDAAVLITFDKNDSAPVRTNGGGQIARTALGMGRWR